MPLLQLICPLQGLTAKNISKKFMPIDYPKQNDETVYDLNSGRANLQPEIINESVIKEKDRSGGGTGIRTLGRLLTYAGFQDQCFQPLSHPSAEMFPAAGATKNGSWIRTMAEGQGFEPWVGY